MRTVPVLVDSHLHLDGNLVGHAIVNEILDELIIPNPEREQAETFDRPGWRDMPEQFFLVDMNGDTIVMSRGYALQLKLLLREHDIGARWIDHRTWDRGPYLGKDEFSYRPHQPQAVREIIRHQQLIYKAPTGSGKTVAFIGAVWELHPRRTIIMVDRINLVDQWVKRLIDHMGLRKDEIGVIGDGIWTERRVTVATVQTLHRNVHKLRASGWFRRWSIAWLDECHHVTAETLLELMQLFYARIRGGMSATPDKTGVFELALNTLGEVGYETTQEELRSYGLLVEPEIHVVPTDFEFKYWGDHKADKHGNCDKPGCKLRTKYHRHRNNYHQLKAALIASAPRNHLIANTLLDDDNVDHVQLVITDSTVHIDNIHEILGLRGWVNIPPVYVLTGRENRGQRDSIIEKIEALEEPCIILSTIAGEALDIPIIDRVHLVWPTRKARKTEQNVGRGTRSHDTKAESIVLDYVDWRVNVLSGQFASRVKGCYTPLGFKVNAPDDEDPDAPRRRGGLVKSL